MSEAGDLVRDAFRIEERGVDWRSGILGALGAIGPLAVGLAADEVVAGLTAAIGGLNTALCVPRARPRTRWWWGSVALIGGAGSVAVADLASPHTAALALATLVWVGAWAFLRAAGTSGAIVGFATCAILVVLEGFPAAAPLGQRLAWYLLGAGPALLLMVAARRGPEAPGYGGGDSGASPRLAAGTTPRLAADSLRALRFGILRDRALRAHALRLAVAVAAATLLYRAVDLPHGYWVALTTLAILQPGEHATRVRALQRAIGTLGGAAAIVLITLLTEERWALVAAAALAAFWLYALDERGYFWLVVMITPTVLLMLSVVDFEGEAVVAERILNSAIGIAIGLAIGELAWRIPLPPTRPASGTAP